MLTQNQINAIARIAGLAHKQALAATAGNAAAVQALQAQMQAIANNNLK